MGVIPHPVAPDANAVEVKSHTEKLLNQIYEHFDGQLLIDVTFKLSNPNALIPAHRLILSAASPYFKELFKTDRGICPQIDFTEIDSGTFERLIVFCYSGKTLLTIDNLDKMLKASLLLRLETAVSNCADFLIEHITEYTLQRAYLLECEVECELLNEKIFKYELEDFLNVVQNNEFLHFAYGKLKKLIENDGLNVQCEKDVFNAVKRWYEHDAFVRKQHLPDLIASLRLNQFDTDFIVANIQSLPGCRELALQAITGIICASDYTNGALKYSKPREVQEKMLLALKLEDDFAVPGCLFQYNKTEGLWQKWFDIENNVTEFQTVFMDDSLIFIGGRRDGEIINNVSSWSFKSKTFKQLPTMNEARYLHGAVVLNDELYAIGGEGNHHGFLQSEKYSVSNGWKVIKSMATPRISPGVVALNGKIYVMGGFNNGQLKSVECYDPTTNSWSRCADMNKAHEMPGVSVHKGKIFIVGDCTTDCDKIVERYDPQANKWTMICALKARRWKIGCISYDNKLWAVGGKHTGDGYKGYVSVYDDGDDKWIEKESMPIRGVYYCFTVPKTLCI